MLVCQYHEPAVILGCSQRPDDAMQMRAAALGFALIRRRAGGGAVLAGASMLSLSLALPANHPLAMLGALALYQWVGEQWQRALVNAGVGVALANETQIARSKQYAEAHDLAWSCFGALGHGELISERARKLVGVAQIRTRHAVTLVTGLHCAPPDWTRLCEIVRNDPQQAPLLRVINDDLHSLGVDPASVIESCTHELSQCVSAA